MNTKLIIPFATFLLLTSCAGLEQANKSKSPNQPEPADQSAPLPTLQPVAPPPPASIAQPAKKMAVRPQGEVALNSASGRAKKDAGSNLASEDKATINEPANTEEYKLIEDNPFQLAKSAPLSTFSIDVDTASYSNVRRFINQGQLPPPDAVRIEEMINYFTYDYPQPKANQPFSIHTEISQAPWQTGHKLVAIGLQSQRLATENLPPSNLVFLLDVSGSMDEANKLPLMKSSLKLLVNQLTAKDRVSIVVYAGSSGLILPPTPGNQKEKIISALDNLQAGGSTAGGEGIKLAYNVALRSILPKGNNRIILATDGDFNVGVSSEAELVRLIEKYRNQGIFLTVLGLGMGNLKDSKMEQLANKGNGNYAYIDSLQEAKKVLVTEMGSTLLTVAKDVKIQVEFNPAKVAAYRLIGYENRMLAAQDFQDDKKDAGELGAGHAVTALYEIIPVGAKTNVKLPSVDNLRYQDNQAKPSAMNNNELMLVKLRYKSPKAETSKLIEQVIIDRDLPLAKTSNDFKLAAAVAEYGLLLRNSPYKSQANYQQVLELANQAKATDLSGYRTEFIKLVESTKKLADK